MDASSQSSLHEAATDCLCAALYKCEDLKTYGKLAESLFGNVIALHQSYAVCAAQSDTDRFDIAAVHPLPIIVSSQPVTRRCLSGFRCLNFTRIFTEMAESFTDALIHFPDKVTFTLLLLAAQCLFMCADSLFALSPGSRQLPAARTDLCFTRE